MTWQGVTCWAVYRATHRRGEAIVGRRRVARELVAVFALGPEATTKAARRVARLEFPGRGFEVRQVREGCRADSWQGRAVVARLASLSDG